MSVLLSATGLGKEFRGPRRGAPTRVLRDVTLSVAEGEFVAVVGPSGSGKSTLLACLAGLEPATSGRVELAGIDLSTLGLSGLARHRRRTVSVIFQAYNLLPTLTVRENVELPARLAHRRPDERDVMSALDELGLLACADRLPSELSGGQQQRTAIARAIVAATPVLLADEPTGALDQANGRVVLERLAATAGARRAVLLVTHDLDAAARCDRVLVLRDGRLVNELVSPTSRQVFDAVAATT
ncbi:ABC transporter ATP-binding protein [Herbiconiux moechotypicola]|uniref:ABC transporter ATP-binding protein n=1 Tax=Herbiconiux moechotypicola TaxID=637393 RepID=A0ABP5Q9E9_9MICO|nr:ABC transporter ATP-binding protein [Herbiconiux moechotypicola]MCS5729317.1 ABC transporter ATP-binding protein [Herbiconiux moechotypicola]